MPPSSLIIGRYRLYDEIAAGGMGSVSIGRFVGPGGFSKTVAIKRMHPHLARDPEFAAMFLDEARLAARIRHPNVASILDVVAADGELIVVMEYIHGEALSKIRGSRTQAGGEPMPPRIAVSVMTGVLAGLHAAHEATDDRGEPLMMVHRDVSPQNILVGADGVARVVDFGIAKAVGRLQTTRDGRLKGKLGYMAPEQARLRPTDRRTDLYAVSVVLWELLTGRRMRSSEPEAALMEILRSKPEPPSAYASDIPSALEALVLKGLARRPAARHTDAHEMAVLLESALAPATPREVAEFVLRVSPHLSERARRVAEIESQAFDGAPGPPALEPPPVASSADSPPAVDGPADTQNTDLSASAGRRFRGRGRGVVPGVIAASAIATAAIVGVLRRDAATDDAPAAPDIETPAPTAAAAGVSATTPASADAPIVSPQPQSEPDGGAPVAPRDARRPGRPKPATAPRPAKSTPLDFDGIRRK